MARHTPANTRDVHRVILYVRVSSVRGRSGDEFHSPDVQIDGMRRLLAQDATLRETAVIDDDIDVSGQTFDRRGLARIRAAVEAGEVDVIAVYTLSRIGRNLAESLTFIRWLRERNVRIISATEKIDETPAGQFMVAMFLNMAELQGNQIAENWSRIIERRARAGKPHGRPKHGYLKTPDGHYVRDPHLGPAVTRLFHRYAAGDLISAITDEYARIRGRSVAKSQIKSMLRDPVYLGRIVLKSSVGGVIDIPGSHEPLVDEDTWRRVQQRLAVDSVAPPRHLEPAYSLTGLGMCIYCKHNLQVMHARDPKNGQVSRRLQCTYRVNARGCKGIGTPLYQPIEDALLEEVRQYAERLRGNPGAQAAKELRAARAGSDAAVVKRELAQTREAMGRLTERWARGGVPDDAYDLALKNLAAAETAQAKALEEAQVLLDAPPVGKVVDLAERLLVVWPDLNESERNQGLRRLVKRFVMRRREFWMEPEGDRIEAIDFID
jgi:site-specific DNA recombinase